MLGNVWQWCQDWAGDYPNGSVKDSQSPNYGSYRVFRGGSWLSRAAYVRSANRFSNAPDVRSYECLGFRVVAVAQTQ